MSSFIMNACFRAVPASRKSYTRIIEYIIKQGLSVCSCRGYIIFITCHASFTYKTHTRTETSSIPLWVHKEGGGELGICGTGWLRHAWKHSNRSKTFENQQCQITQKMAACQNGRHITIKKKACFALFAVQTSRVWNIIKKVGTHEFMKNKCERRQQRYREINRIDVENKPPNIWQVNNLQGHSQ